MKMSKSSKVDLPELYHISFNGSLEGVWTPREPDGMDLYKEDTAEEDLFPYPEPSVGRISVSPTIEGCFLGVYPNIKQYFEEKKYPYIVMIVYSPKFNGSEDVLVNKDILKNRYVWDAHITEESWILSKVEMVKVGDIKIYNPRKTVTKHTHPFNDKHLDKIDYRVPSVIRYKWL